MKHFVAIFLATTSIAGTALAEDGGFYGQLSAYGVRADDQTASVGATTIEVENDFGFGVGGSLGYGFNNGIRLEGEISYRETDVEGVTGNLEATSYMGNIFYDFDIDSSFTPYIGAGLGITDVGDAASDTATSYQGMAGVAYDISDNGALVFGYRYLATDDLNFNVAGSNVDLSEYETHNLELGYRHRF